MRNYIRRNLDPVDDGIFKPLKDRPTQTLFLGHPFRLRELAACIGQDFLNAGWSVVYPSEDNSRFQNLELLMSVSWAAFIIPYNGGYDVRREAYACMHFGGFPCLEWMFDERGHPINWRFQMKRLLRTDAHMPESYFEYVYGLGKLDGADCMSEFVPNKVRGKLDDATVMSL